MFTEYTKSCERAAIKKDVPEEAVSSETNSR